MLYCYYLLARKKHRNSIPHIISVISLSCRSRSRSPASEARSRLPADLLQHLEFGLVEPSQDSVRGDIPFTNVETARPVRLRGGSRSEVGGGQQQHRRQRNLSGSSQHARRM